MPAKDVVIMAQFEDFIDRGFEYAVEFDGNGADEGEMEDQTFYEKEEQTLNLNEYAREGYTFLGWARSPEAEEAEFEDGALITEPLVDKEGRIRTLYAVWEEDKGEEESQPTSDEAETSPSESQTDTPTQPTQPPTQPTQPPTATPTAHQESWTSPTNSSPQSVEPEDVPVNVVTTDEEETEVETPEAETEENMTDREPNASETPTVPPSSESTEKEEQAVKRIRLVLGIAIGVVAAAIVVAVVFYQKEKRRHGGIL